MDKKAQSGMFPILMLTIFMLILFIFFIKPFEDDLPRNEYFGTIQDYEVIRSGGFFSQTTRTIYFTDGRKIDWTQCLTGDDLAIGSNIYCVSEEADIPVLQCECEVRK